MHDNKHIAVVGCLIRNGSGKVLLVRHYKRGWEIPQGRVQEGESLLAALYREVLEETGVEVEVGPLAAVWSKISPPAALIFTFLARHSHGEPRSSDETPEVGWFEEDKVLKMVEHPVNRDRIENLLNYSGQTVFRAFTSNPYLVVPEKPLS